MTPSPPWTCLTCGRTFRRPHQPHACDLSTRSTLLVGKPLPLVKVYRAVERDLRKWGPHEAFIRQRYVLFRTTRGFADLVFMKEGLRLAIYLNRHVSAPYFFKVGRSSAHRIIHVAMIRTLTEWRTVRPYLKEAFRFAQAEDAARQSDPATSVSRRQRSSRAV